MNAKAMISKYSKIFVSVLLIAILITFFGCGIFGKKKFYKITDGWYEGDALRMFIAFIAVESNQFVFNIDNVALTFYYGNTGESAYSTTYIPSDIGQSDDYEKIGCIVYFGEYESTWARKNNKWVEDSDFGSTVHTPPLDRLDIKNYNYDKFEDYKNREADGYRFVKEIRPEDVKEGQYKLEKKGNIFKAKYIFAHSEVLTIPSDLLKKGLENSNKTSICFYIMQVFYSKQENSFVSYMRSGIKLNFESTDNGKKVKIS